MRGRGLFAAAIGASMLSWPPVLATEAPPAALVQARAAFAAAVAAKDVKAAEKLTNFPLKNTVFQAPPTISQAAFPKQMKLYAEMKDCLKTAPLELPSSGGGAPKSWTVDCDGNLFHFALKNGRWLHDEYENINE
jgi:hypothetical protein